MRIIQIAPLLLLLWSFSVRAQESDEAKTKLKEKLAIKLEYFGELVLHPGLSIGLDYTVKTNNWATVHWDIDLGGYWHRWNHTSVFLKTTIGSRLVIGPVFTDINIGIGYMHSWAAGAIYQRTEEQNIKKAINWGHSHFMPNASFLIGWDGRKRNSLPWRIYLGPEIYLQSSFNHIFLPHIAAKIGFAYKFNQQ
ncbi:hypothetical protein [Membranihabitans maritimus]|uniref:hypothetical protein n=1 Tax=Membranihabitans maritimus TaxID=2904244 RepID=UPI001F28E773|nr:hypothetical protein [Membranihabitans maritimus]